jgi:hypothetical protein
METKPASPAFGPALPHGDLQEPFGNVFFVTGTTKPTMMGMEWQFSRNMTVVRDGTSLTIINSVRLDDEGLKKLDALGKVTNVVRLGSFHGMDDAFYVDRYSAKLWALPGMTHESGKATDVEMKVGGEMPFESSSLFVYETASAPEGLILINRDGGILIACDSLQNWTGPDAYFSEQSAKLMGEYGFFRSGNVGPGWRKGTNPQASDFKRVNELKFRHLLSGHGTPLTNEAPEKLRATFTELFGI